MSTETLTHAEECQEYGLTCAECEEHSCTERLDGANGYRYANVTQEELCESCYESECEYLSSVILFDPSEEEEITYLIGDSVAFDQYGDDAPSGIRRRYVSTDGWRGYHVTEIDNTEEIDSGADLWGLETDIRSIAERIKQEHKDGTLPVPVYVVADLTSNVFSVVLTVRVSKANAISFRRWLNQEEE